MTIRPRRSVLYMPGSNARAMEKAKTLPIDAVILDLEDSVAPDAKAEARKTVVDMVQGGGFGRREVFVRTNATDTPWFGEDLQAAVAASPDVVLVPKISSAGDLVSIGRKLDEMKADPRLRVWAMIETPLAIFAIDEIAAVAKDPVTRLGGFVMGVNDLSKESRVRIVPGRWPMTGWLANCVLAAHAYGIDIVDGVYNALSDLEGFKRECIEGRDLGFDGRTLIHPNQIEICNTVYSPTKEEVALARKMIAAFDLPENKAKGVVQIDGRMVERLHAEMARRTVAIAEAITG